MFYELGAGNKYKAQTIKSRSFRGFQFCFFFLTKAKDRSSKGDKRSISVKVSQGEEQQLSRQWIQLMNKPMFCVQHMGCFLSKY